MTIDPERFPHMIDDEVLHAEDLADPAVRAEYDRLGPRYALISAIVGARARRGWTQTDLARACGTSQSSIARLESGDHDPRWSTAVRVCKALDIPLLLNGTSAA